MTTATPPRPDVDLETLLGDLEPACDDPFENGCDSRARWVLRVTCGCPVEFPLYCDACRAAYRAWLAPWRANGYGIECKLCHAFPIEERFDPL